MFHKEIKEEHYNNALKSGLKLLKMSTEFKDELLIATAQYLIGDTYYKLDKKQLSKHFLMKAINYFNFHKNKDEYLNISETLGILLSSLGNYNEALSYYNNVLKKITKSNNTEKKIQIISKIGGIYQQKKEINLSIENFKLCKKMAQSINNYKLLALSEYNLGSSYIHLRDIENAKIHFEFALISSKRANEKIIEGRANDGLAGVFYYKQKIDLGIKFEKKAIACIDENSNDIIRFGFELNLAQLYIKNNEIDKSLDIAKLIFAKLNKKDEFILIHKAIIVMAQIYEEKGNFQKSLALLKQAVNLKDKHSLENNQKKAKDNQEHINQIIAEFEIEQKEKENIILNQELIISKNKLTEMALGIIKRDGLIQKISTSIKKNNNNILIKEINRFYNDKNEINEFEVLLKNVNSKFLDKLNELHPLLSPREKKICSLIYINMNSKEIAKLTNLDMYTINHYRYKIRKKLGLNRNDNLSNFINSI